jgi:hypothetical protein
MWWIHYWPGPWMLLGPMMMFVLMIAFMAAMFFMMRMGPMRRSEASLCGFGFGRLGRHVGVPPEGRHAAFEEYREETLRLLDEEHREFQDFISHLRMAKDKTEFDQFMAERRNQPSQG